MPMHHALRACLRSQGTLMWTLPLCRGPIEGELHTGLQAAHRRYKKESACRAASLVEAAGRLGATGKVRPTFQPLEYPGPTHVCILQVPHMALQTGGAPSDIPASSALPASTTACLCIDGVKSRAECTGTRLSASGMCRKLASMGGCPVLCVECSKEEVQN